MYGAGLDVDGNGVADWWELTFFGHTGMDKSPTADADGDGVSDYQEYLNGTDPTDFYDGHAPQLSVYSGDQQSAGNKNTLLPAPLVVQVLDPNGTPLSNTQVTFAVTAGGGSLKASSSKPLVTPLMVSTDGSGQAQTYFQLPNQDNQVCQITARVGAGSHQVQTSFIERTGDGTAPPPASPFTPSDLFVQGNFDGSFDISWVNHTDADDTAPIKIEFQQADGSWLQMAVADAQATSYHYSPP